MVSEPKHNLWVEISPDGKAAWLHDEDGMVYSPGEIMEALKSAGVIKGIHSDKVEKATRGHKLLRSEHIADRILPKMGRAARLEYLVTHEVKPILREDGTMNFREINLIMNVKEGQPLVRKIPPEVGQPGYLVTGSEMPGKKGKDISLSSYVGKGTKVSDKNPNVITAAHDGAYKEFRSGKVSVLGLYNVRGNVDYSTGNIHSASSVSISGDVKAGFMIECEEDVAVEGLIENANIDVKGDLNVKLGITQGVEPIIVKGVLNAMYIYNRAAVQAGEADIREMVSFSNLFIDGKVTAKRIVGGEVVAKDDILVEIAGSNRHESKTSLTAGLDFEKKERRDKLMTSLSEKEDRLQLLDQEMEDLNRWAVEFENKSDEVVRQIAGIEDSYIGRKIKDSIQKKLNRLNRCRQELIEVEDSIKELKDEIDTLNRELTNPAAEVIVSGTVFAGVSIAIGESASLNLKKKARRVVFKLDKDGQIVQLPMGGRFYYQRTGKFYPLNHGSGRRGKDRTTNSKAH